MDTHPASAMADPSQAHAFTFGDPEGVLDRREILELLECPSNGKWYEPPISMEGLARSSRAAVHHASAMAVKCNILTGCFIPHPLLSVSEFSSWALDFLVFGNGYVERRDNLLGKPIKLKQSKAKYTRRGLDLETYFFVPGYNQEHQFRTGAVHHLMQTDINQDIYGLPEYIPALQSAWLNESATLFRRRYYLNGNHAGFILYMTDATQQESDITALREALKSAKGPGNFRNLFVYAPNGKKDGMQVIPVSEVAAKDDFMAIKNTTRDDQLAAHRVPPQLLGLVPNNTGGFGDAEKAAKVFNVNEILPLMARFKELNDWLGVEVIRFKEYELAKTAPAA